MANVEVLDQLTLKISRDAVNLIPVRWLNESGGTSQFSFKQNYFNQNAQKNGKSLVIDDFSKKSSIKSVSVSYERSIKVGIDNIDYDTWVGISKIFFAEVYINGEWEACSIAHDNSEIAVKEGSYRRELTIMRTPYKLQEF